MFRLAFVICTIGLVGGCNSGSWQLTEHRKEMTGEQGFAVESKSTDTLHLPPSLLAKAEDFNPNLRLQVSEDGSTKLFLRRLVEINRHWRTSVIFRCDDKGIG